MEPSKKLIPLSALATRLGVPVGWLREQADRGEIPSLVISRRRYFDEELARKKILARMTTGGKKSELE